MTPWPTSCCAWPGTPRSTSGSLRRHRVSGTQVTQGTLWDEPPIEVMLAAYDVTLASTSAGKDSSAMLAYLVARARVEGVLDRLVAVHADLGVIEFRVRSACCPRPCCRGPRSAGGCPTSGCCTGLAVLTRERRAPRLGFRDRQPILVDPDYRVDPRLSEFFRRSRFATRAPGTQESYALDYRLLFTFLWRQGRYWDQARPEDLEDYEYWRRKDQRNPVRVGGAKWARELAAFRLLYTWAARHGHVPGSPVVVHTHQRRDGRTVEVAELAPRDVRSTNVKWLTPRAYRLWRDVGLRGYRADGLLDDAWRGRNEGRDAAFADLLLSSGLRRREAATLLLAELT